MLEEEARLLVKQYIPPIPKQELVAALRYSVQLLNSYGITSMQDAGVDDDEELEVYTALEDAGELTMHVVAAMRWYPDRGMEQVPQLVAWRDQYSDDLIDAATVKIWQDGILEAYTAAMLEPYLIPGGSRGSKRRHPR